MWRTTPLHRRELRGALPDDAPPGLPPDVGDDVQAPDDGVGPLFHRRYVGRVRDPKLSPDELMAVVSADPNRVAPREFARFTKTSGPDDRMEVGDEFVVRMPGPWDGPVRVVARTPTSFRLATLDGHLEAGQIEFRAECDDRRRLVYTIESWASSGDRLSKLLYQHLRMAKEVQFHMWTSVLERVAELAGGRLDGGIEAHTRRVEVELDGQGPRLRGRNAEPGPGRDSDARRLLDDLHEKAVNFDVEAQDAFTPDQGWLVDEYEQPLPSEPAGPPVPGGSWEVARRLLRDYEFADPDIVRAVYHPDRPLDERDMLLEARFWGLEFRLGVRVGGVRDETVEVDGRSVRIWGWNYRTLQGHLEMGQMDFEVWKWLDTGQVEFRTRRFSRHAHVRNPVVRLGLWVFGRREQVRFARRACDRMASLTAAALRNAG
jgi:uncharacterized protein (UPF0548 family)